MSQHDPLHDDAYPPQIGDSEGEISADVSAEQAEDALDESASRLLRARGSDPAFGLILGFAVSIGLAPLNDPSLRYTLSWGVLAAFGVLSWLLGSLDPIGEEKPDTLVWGVGFGLLIGVPLMLFGGGTLTATVRRAFGMMTPGEMLAYVLFVMPIAETLFFRGLLHGSRPFWMVALIASGWSIALYLPLLDVGNYPLVAVVICVMLVMLNTMYGYVRNRNGLAAAWICQLVANLLVLFLPFVTG